MTNLDPQLEGTINQIIDRKLGNIQEDDFADLNTTENVAKLIVLMNRKKLTPKETADKMGIPAERFNTWISDFGAIRFRDQLLTCKRTEIIELAGKYEKKEFPQGSEKESKTFNVQKVAKLLLEFKDLDVIVKKLRTTRKEFLPWYERNLRAVNKVYSHLRSEKNVIRNPE